MANLKNVYEISKGNYNSLVGGTAVSGYSFESNSVYLQTNVAGAWSLDTVKVDANSTSFIQCSSDLPSGQTSWFVEGWSDLTCGTVNFGIITLDSSANTSSSYPLTIFGVNTTSTTLTTNTMVRIEMYYSSSRWYIRVSTSNSSYSSFTNVATYNLVFRRIYI